VLDGLRPTADQSEALETQVYQAILKRQPAPMIRRLTEILASPDPSLGYINGRTLLLVGLGARSCRGPSRCTAQLAPGTQRTRILS
jgi:hypothetical protein